MTTSRPPERLTIAQSASAMACCKKAACWQSSPLSPVAQNLSLRPAQEVLLPGHRDHLDAGAICTARGLVACPSPRWLLGESLCGSLSQCSTLELVGLTITVQATSGKSWDATITEVAEDFAAHVLVRTRKLDQ